MIRSLALVAPLLAPLALLGACTTMKKVDRTFDDGVRAVARTPSAVAGAITREDAPESLDRVGRPDDLGDAMMTPVRDLNLRKVEVPAALLRISRPYGDIPRSCDRIALEIAELDDALGPDYDRLPLVDATSRTKVERAGLGLLGSAMGDLIPFRGVVRRLSGATKEERELREFYRIGIVRRGFLRGISDERGCG